ncbi:MAG TPA: MFS transporter, partial [Pyrinomonadaceae bacterium]
AAPFPSPQPAATIAVGSALGGVVATALGRDTVFVLNALTFLASAEMIRRIRKPLSAGLGARGGGVEPRPPSSSAAAAARPTLNAYFKDFREGLRYVRRDRVLAVVLVVAAGWGLGNGAARALYSLFGAALGEQAAARWGASVGAVAERPTDFGISVLFVAMGLGGVLGAPLARRFNSGAVEGLGARMGRSLTLGGCGLLLFSLTPNLFGAAALLVAREMNFAIWWTAQQTLLMRRTEDAFAGRVFASYETLTTLTMVGSMLVSGAAADRLGMRAVAAGGGGVIILSGLLWFVLRRRGGETG